MLSSTIVWEKDNVDQEYTSRTGRDTEGNIYHISANMETVTCTTTDGFYGCGFTATDARANANERRSNWKKNN
jgi:hypothetical protein